MDSMTVAECAQQRLGLTIDCGIDRFGTPGWFDTGSAHCPCPCCGNDLWSFRKPYESSGKTCFYWALVCAACKRAIEPAQLSPERRKLLYASSSHRPTPVAAIPAATPSVGPAPHVPGEALVASIELRVQAASVLLGQALAVLQASVKELEVADCLSEPKLVQAAEFALGFADHFLPEHVQLSLNRASLCAALEEFQGCLEDEGQPRSKEDVAYVCAILKDIARRLHPYPVERRALKEARELSQQAARLPSRAKARSQAEFGKRVARLNVGPTAPTCKFCRPAARMRVVGEMDNVRWRCLADNHGTLFLTRAQLRVLYD